MPVTSETVSGALVLERGALRVEICRHPFGVHVRRDGRRLIRGLGEWVAEGEVHDQFIQFTEGVVAREASCQSASSRERRRAAGDGALLAVRCEGGRAGRLRITLPATETVLLELEVDGTPLRPAADWDARAEEHFAGLGARHALRVDHAGREIQLGRTARTPPRLPGRLPRRRRHPTGRLRARAMAAVLARLRGLGAGPRQRHALRARRRQDRRVGARERRAAAVGAAERSHAGSAAAPLPARH